jgi:uncharacterized protein (DUF1015 family)
MPDNAELNDIIKKVSSNAPDNDLVDSMQVRHTSWIIKDKAVADRVQAISKETKYFYIADGHHRSAAGAIVGRERSTANPNHTGKEEYNYYLAVLFPASHLMIMDYNRVVIDLNGNSDADFFDKLNKIFIIEEQSKQFAPTKKSEVGMYINNK